MNKLQEVMENIVKVHGRTEPILWDVARDLVERKFPHVSWYEVCKALLETFKNRSHSPTPNDFVEAAKVAWKRHNESRVQETVADGASCMRCHDTGLEECIMEMRDDDQPYRYALLMIPCRTDNCPFRTTEKHIPAHYNQYTYTKYHHDGPQERRMIFYTVEMWEAIREGRPFIHMGVTGRTVLEWCALMNRKARGEVEEVKPEPGNVQDLIPSQVKPEEVKTETDSLVDDILNAANRKE